jgi:hypothetical protein
MQLLLACALACQDMSRVRVSRSQPSLTSTSGNPESAVSRYPFRGELASKMQGDLSLSSEAPKSILQKTDRDDLTDGQLNGIECYRSQTLP